MFSPSTPRDEQLTLLSSVCSLSMFNTPTTPTLTPTLKNISEVPLAHEEDPFRPLEHNHQGGFVPPIIDFAGSLRSSHPSSALGQENMSSNSNFCNSINSQDEDSVSSNDSDSQSTSVYSQEGSQSNDSRTVSKAYNTRLKNGSSKSSGNKSTTGSGRASRKGGDKVTPEEEAKRKMRRERNKQAAARCRKRRLDHTNLLTKQTEELDKEKKKLEQECEKERKEIERFKMFLEEHKKSSECKCKQQQQQATAAIETNMQPSPPKICRPNTLDLKPIPNLNPSLPPELVPNTTPSNGVVPSDWFEGTGLTPLLQTPSAGGFMPGLQCISATRLTSETVQSSNEATTPSKLVSL